MQFKKRDYASPPNYEIWGDGEIFSLICPLQPQDQVGAPGYHIINQLHFLFYDAYLFLLTHSTLTQSIDSAHYVC